MIPLALQKSSISVEQNSPPPSVLNTLIFLEDWFSTIALNTLNTENTSYLALSRYTHIFLLYSSTNETKYLFPPSEAISKGPQTSEYITSSTAVDLAGVQEPNEEIDCLLT